MKPPAAITRVAESMVTLIQRSAATGGKSLAARGLVPLLHVTSAAARRLAQAPSPFTTPTQKLALQALGGQLRAAAAQILPSEASGDPNSLEGALAQAVTDTLRLLESALHEDAALGRSPEAATPAPLPFEVREEAPALQPRENATPSE